MKKKIQKNELSSVEEHQRNTEMGAKDFSSWHQSQTTAGSRCYTSFDSSILLNLPEHDFKYESLCLLNYRQIRRLPPSRSECLFEET